MVDDKDVQPAGDTSHRFRTDIEGLRALAVVFVLIHHAEVSLLPGGFIGVDMFFVVSGFVITTQLVREVERSDTVDLPGFYARRAKRLLPAASMVLVFTAILSWLFASRVQWSLIGTDLVGSALYVVNWVFAARSVDYLAEDVQPSPVQHFWSLAVEEQFYIVWPLLIIGLALSARSLARRRASAGKRRIPLQSVLAAGLLVVVVVPSLAWSIYYTFASPAEAYFVTTTRLWELGIGALAAVLAPTWYRLSARVAAGVAWGGLALLLISVALIDLRTPWPGAAALGPTVATALVIIGGFKAGNAGPVRVLGVAPLVWIGGLSYSLYLWHWPLLSAGEWIWGSLGIWQGLAIALASVIPAWVGYHIVEKPFRYSKAFTRSPKFALSMGINFTLAGVVAGLILSTAATAGQAGSNATRTSSGYGLGSGPNDTPLYETVTPDPTLATEDLPDIYARGCQVEQVDTEVIACASEVATEGDISIAVVGDSKVAQWVPPIEEIAVEEGWKVTSYTKSSCSFSRAVQAKDGEPYEECVVWNDELQDILLDSPPDVVITAGNASRAIVDGGESQPAMADGYAQAWTELEDAGIPVIVVSDTPQPGGPEDTPYECVANNADDAAEYCTWPSAGGSSTEAFRAALDQVPGAAYIDMNQYICPDGTCYAVYRNVLTYRQGSHITATFALLLQDSLASELVPAVTEALKNQG